VTRDLPVLREVFGGAAAFAPDPAGIARALAHGASRDAAAAARLRLYGTLVAGGAPATGVTDEQDESSGPRFVPR